MTSERRIGAETSATRLALLDAAQRLMLEEGYAAVTSRRVAAEANLKPQLVHYYFRTMDDLFLALFRRGAERNLERQAEALASPQPLRALWELGNEPAGTALTLEFTALANHRKAIRAEIAGYAELFRRQQTAAVSDALERHGVDADEFPALAVLVVMNGLARVMAMEATLGLTSGHAEAVALVERYLDRLEPAQELSAKVSSATMTVKTFADVTEGVRATIAAYTHALDDGRTDDIVATYTAEGVFDMPGTGTFVGHDALRDTYGKWKPRRPQRHMVVNTLVTEWDDLHAQAVSDVVFARQGDSGWRIEFVARYHDVLAFDESDGGWKFERRTVVA